jgi:hypothetical protein
MGSKMKQTAVEWLVSQLNKQGFSQVVTDEEIKQAKEMEKEQLCYFYVKGAEAELNNPYVTNIEFYNQTFKSK